MARFQNFSIKESNAFVETFEILPTASGHLSNLTFAVKDMIDVAGHRTGCGNPTWQESHPIAIVHALCVQQLLNAGATCIGKTVMDELAFGLNGENHFYGTPLNPRAPDRVPGGSSSGSASAVACGVVDFAIGTDTGGSIRIPASNCGLYGMRPSHGYISLAGVMPFAPSFDTIGLVASSVNVLIKAASSLLSRPAYKPVCGTIYVIEEINDLLDSDVQAFFQKELYKLNERFLGKVKTISFSEIIKMQTFDWDAWKGTFSVIQWAEIWSCLGSWIENVKPIFGPRTAESFHLAKNLDRIKVSSALALREYFCECFETFLQQYDFICKEALEWTAPKILIIRKPLL
jgi:amidase